MHIFILYPCDILVPTFGNDNVERRTNASDFLSERETYVGNTECIR